MKNLICPKCGGSFTKPMTEKEWRRFHNSVRRAITSLITVRVNNAIVAKVLNIDEWIKKLNGLLPPPESGPVEL